MRDIPYETGSGSDASGRWRWWVLTFTCAAIMFASAGESKEKVVKHRTEVPKTTPAEMRVVKKFELEDFKWVSRKLAKAPAFKSEKPRYTIFVLGHGKKSVMTIVWDESGGTGSGHDTLYVDRNCNGDLTDDGDAIKLASSVDRKGKKSKFLAAKFSGIKEIDGDKVYDFSFELSAPLKFTFRTKVMVKRGTEKLYYVGLCPGRTDLAHGESLEKAPIYRVGGPAVPVIHQRISHRKRAAAYPGDEVQPLQIGVTVSFNIILAHIGDRKTADLRFHTAAHPGVGDGVRLINIWGHARQSRGAGYPLGILRVLGKEGQVVQEVPLQPGGC